MNDILLPRSRIVAAGIAVLAGSAVLTLYALDVFERGRDPIMAALAMFGWFTIWSNAAVALIAAQAGMGGRASGLAHPGLLCASTVWIVVVGLIYNTLLAGLNHPPTLLRQAIDTVFHIITPAAWAAWWLWLRPAGMLRWAHLGWVLPVPLAYCFVSLWAGGRTGRYAYFFIDVGTLGWGQVAINIAALAGLFTGLMALAIAWDRRRPR